MRAEKEQILRMIRTKIAEMSSLTREAERLADELESVVNDRSINELVRLRNWVVLVNMDLWAVMSGFERVAEGGSLDRKD